MGFWNALSVLAPVAPAMSDAKDLRTSRDQQAQTFAQDTELKKAQVLAQQLAAERTQQEITQGKAPVAIPGTKNYYDPSQGSWMQPSLVNGEFKPVKIPGEAPAAELNEAAKGLKDAFAAMGQEVPSGLLADLAYRTYGGTGSFNAMSGLGVPKAVTLADSEGKPFPATFWGGHYYDAQGGEISSPKTYEKPSTKTPTMKAGTINGKSAFAYYSSDKGAWIDSNTGEPVSNFIPQPSFAQTGLYGLDTGYDASGNPVAMLLDRRTGKMTPAPAGLIAPAQSKGIETQRTAAIAGDSLLRTMMGAADRAKAGDQQAMLSVVANHIGMTLGAQKGARINQAVWNEATESAPWLQNVTKKWSPDGYLQGVVLSPQQVDQMVELGKLRRDVMWQQAAQTAEAAGVPLQVPEFQLKPTAKAKSNPTNPAAGAGEAKQHSLRTAMALPFNKGKTAAQVKADLESLGYTVVP